MSEVWKNRDIADLERLCVDLTGINQRLATALTAISVMDVYTRPGEKPASEVMRDIANTALTSQKRVD